MRIRNNIIRARADRLALVLSRIGFYFLVLCILGCATAPPTRPDNICQIFAERPKWYKAAQRSADHWGGPIHLPMAIMYQESAFKRKAKPRMQYFLGIIPTGRASDAYGYSQALQSTWAEYQREVGSSFRNRDNFANSFDFIQWYMHKTYTRNAVSKWDGYAQYLNYHEGQGGYARGSYQGKKWLLDTASRVDQRSKRYAAQLARCQADLDRNKGWF